MPILVSCKCGKKLRLKDELAGKRVKCPGCGQCLAVPAGEEPPVLEEVEPVEERVSPPPAARGPRPAPRPAPEERSPDGSDDAGDEGPDRRSRGADSPTPYWVHSNDLLAISDDTVYLTTLDAKQRRRVQEDLQAGRPAGEVLEGAETVIALDTITKVEGNLYHTFFDIKYKEPDAKEESETTIHCADERGRDEILRALRDRLGPDWERQVKEYTRLRASLEPLIVIGFFGFLTFCFYMAGAHPEADKSGGKVVRTNWLGAIFVWVYNVLGPWGVVSIGGLVVALGVAWLVARVIKPPLMLTLTPRQAPRRRKRTEARS
jgi:hypothetical protein